MIFSSLFFFIVVHYFMVWTHCNLFILHLVHLACFQFLSIMNNTTWNIFMHVCLWSMYSFWLCTCPGVELLRYFSFNKYDQTFPQSGHIHLHCHLQWMRVPVPLHLHQLLILLVLLNLAILVPHCGCTLHFPHDKWFWHVFLCLFNSAFWTAIHFLFRACTPPPKFTDCL